MNQLNIFCLLETEVLIKNKQVQIAFLCLVTIVVMSISFDTHIHQESAYESQQ